MATPSISQPLPCLSHSASVACPPSSAVVHPKMTQLPSLSSPSAFSPPIFCVQLVLERISSPWEPNFGGLHSLDIRFVGGTIANAAAMAAVAHGQIRVGSGRLFFLRAAGHGTEPAEWLELRGKPVGGGGQLQWSGRVALGQFLDKGPVPAPVVCQLQGQSLHGGPVLEAHLLLSMAQVERSSSRSAAPDKRVDTGVQTTEEKAKSARSRSDKGTQTDGIGWQQSADDEKRPNGLPSRRALLRVLLWLLIRVRRENGLTKPPPLAGLRSQGTLTRVSIPPEGVQLLQMLSARGRAQADQLRAKIGYLSAVHRTLVPSPKKKEEAGSKKKREEHDERIGSNLASTMTVMRNGPMKDINEPHKQQQRRGLLTALPTPHRVGIGTGGVDTRRMNHQQQMVVAAANDDLASIASSGGLQSVALSSNSSIAGGPMRREDMVKVREERRGEEVSRKSSRNNNDNIGTRKVAESTETTSSSPKTPAGGRSRSSTSGNSAGTNSSKKRHSHAQSRSSASSSSSSTLKQSSDSLKSASSSQSNSEGSRGEEGTGDSSSATASRESRRSSTVIGGGSSVATDSSVPMEIASAVASSVSSNSSSTVRSEHENRQSPASKYLKDLRKKVLNDL